MFEKRARLISFYGWSERHTKWGLTGARGWAYYAWALENEGGGFGRERRRTTDGYLAQEIEAIKERRKK